MAKRRKKNGNYSYRRGRRLKKASFFSRFLTSNFKPIQRWFLSQWPFKKAKKRKRKRSPFTVKMKALRRKFTYLPDDFKLRYFRLLSLHEIINKRSGRHSWHAKAKRAYRKANKQLTLFYRAKRKIVRRSLKWRRDRLKHTIKPRMLLPEELYCIQLRSLIRKESKKGLWVIVGSVTVFTARYNEQQFSKGIFALPFLFLSPLTFLIAFAFLFKVTLVSSSSHCVMAWSQLIKASCKVGDEVHRGLWRYGVAINALRRSLCHALIIGGKSLLLARQRCVHAVLKGARALTWGACALSRGTVRLLLQGVAQLALRGVCTFCIGCLGAGRRVCRSIGWSVKAAAELIWKEIYGIVTGSYGLARDCLFVILSVARWCAPIIKGGCCAVLSLLWSSVKLSGKCLYGLVRAVWWVVQGGGLAFCWLMETVSSKVEAWIHFVTERVAGKSLLGLRLFLLILFVGVSGYYGYRQFLIKGGSGEYNMDTKASIVAFARPCIEKENFESVAAQVEPASPILQQAAAADSFSLQEPSTVCVIPLSPRLCVTPPGASCGVITPKVDTIGPCVLTAALRHTWGKGIGVKDGYTTIEQLLFPLELYNHLWPFLDVRLHAFDGGELAVNIGLGYRYYSECANRSFGMNLYYDYRESCHEKRFSQFGLGFEWLGECWDLRLNGYLPVHALKLIQECRWDYDGGYFLEKKKYEEAKRGVDFEVGSHFASVDLFGCGSCSSLSHIDFFAGFGPYYYYGQQCEDKHIVGGRLRLKIQSGKYFSLEGNVTKDSYYGTRYQVQLGIHLPIGCFSCNEEVEHVLSQPVCRNEQIVMDKFCRWRWNY